MNKGIKRILAFTTAVSLILCSCSKNEKEQEEAKRVMVDAKDITMADTYNFEKINSGDVQSVDFSVTVEAEECQAESGVTFKTSVQGFSGEGYVDISNNPDFELTVDIPASQYYKITVKHTAGSHKENALVFNGAKAFDIISEQGDWQTLTVDGVYLEKGENKITLGEGWSWFSLDSITIENGEAVLTDDMYLSVTDTLCNPYANLKTQNIYQYLKAVYGKRVLTGQCTDYGHNTETDAIFKQYGVYPAVRTFDFIFDSMSSCGGNPKAEDVDLAIQWSNDGGIVVYDWHWNAPYKESSFYTDSTSFRITDCKTDIDIATISLDEIKALCDEGKIKMDTVKLIEDIDNISSLMQRMEDADVTVLWRPLHEASGGWFWWGATGAEDYKWLWKLLYHRMTDYHQLDNLIWVWNAQSAEWYVGDEYCDIAALDIYNPAHDYTVSPTAFKDLYEVTGGKKLISMSECATMPDPDLVVRDNAYWLWFAVWNWDYIVKGGLPILSDAYTEFYMMEKVYTSDIYITRDELPDFSKK